MRLSSLVVAGLEFDRTFVKQEIELHRSRLELEEQLRGSTDNVALQDLLRNDLAVIQGDLTRGEDTARQLAVSPQSGTPELDRSLTPPDDSLPVSP